jgi:lipopolysaccharide heptosyltransferase I
MLSQSSSASAPSKILIVRLSAIGDVIHAMPLLCGLRRRYPEARLAWLVEEHAASLLEGHQALDELITVPRGWLKSPRAVARLRRTLRRFAPQVTIDVQGLTKSSLAARLSGARRRIGFGCEKGRELSRWFNTELVRSTAAHVIDSNLELLGPLGVEPSPVEFGVPERPDEAQAARQTIGKLGLQGPFAMINVGAGWPSKLWRADRYAAVASHLGRRWGMAALVVWAGAEEYEMAGRVVAGSEGHAQLAPATTLRELAALARRAALFVGSDTGPLHLAVAVGTPCVGLYGPMPAERNGPYGPRHVALQEMRMEGTSRQRRTASRALMDAIGAEAVSEACDRILQREGRAGLPGPGKLSA